MRHFAVFFLIFLLQSIAFAQNLLRMPESVVYDSTNHRYLASNYTTGHIVAIDSAGHQSYFVQSEYCKNGLHIAGNIVYAACIDSGIKGFDLTTAERVMHVMIEGSTNANDIASDPAGNLYISDPIQGKIFKLRPGDNSFNLFLDCGSRPPNGLWYDEIHHRMLVAVYNQNQCRIRAVNLEDSTISDLVNTGYSYLDGVTMDPDGNVYFSTWETYAVYRFDSLFTQPPMEILVTNAPADIFYNPLLDELAVPVMYGNMIEYLDMTPSAAFNPSAIPDGIQLYPNYPNPFNSITKVTYLTPSTSLVRLSLHNLLGEEVALLTEETQIAGKHEVSFNGSNLASGVYFCRFQSGGIIQTQKMVMLK